MNYNIKPTPRDFNSKVDNKKFKGTPRLVRSGDKIAFKDGTQEVSWIITKIDGNILTLKNGDKTELFDAGAAGIKGAKVFDGNSNNSSSSPKSDYDILLKYGNEEQTKPYLEAIAAKGKAEANKIARTAEYETQKIEHQMERDKRRAEFSGKAKKAVGNFINDAAYYGHEHDTIMKAAKQIEKEAPKFGDAKWVEDNKKSKTHSQILKEATDRVDAANSLYDQQSKTYREYLELKHQEEAGNPEEKMEALQRLNDLYGARDVKGNFIINEKTKKVVRENLPEPPELNSDIIYDPSLAFKENKVAGTVGYATGLLKVAPAVLDDTRDFFKPGDATYFEDKARNKLVQKYADRYKKLEKKHKEKEVRLERIKSTEINDATSRYKSAQSALKKHDEAVEANAKEAETKHQKAIFDIQKDYGKKFEKANLKAGTPLPIVDTESPISVHAREAASNKAGDILKARDKKIESQNKSYESAKKDAETQTKNIRTRLEYDARTAKENKESVEERAGENYETSKAKAKDKLERQKDKLDSKFQAKIGEARFKDKEIENQMAFDKLKGSVQTTSDVAKAGLALISKKARRKQLEEEGVDAVNARNARIAYALGDRSLQTRLAAGKVSPLNSLLHPIQSYKRHQINSNIRANRNVGFSENPEITEYYSGEGWQEKEREAIAKLLDIDYSKFEEQDFAELRPSQNYSQSLIGTEKLIDNNNTLNSLPAQTINSVVESTSIPNHLKETDVTKLNEVLEKSYYSPSPAEKFLQEKLSRGFSENEKTDTEYENMLEDIYQRASSSRIV